MTTRGSGGTAHTCSGRHSQYTVLWAHSPSSRNVSDELYCTTCSVTWLYQWLTCVLFPLYRFLVLAGVSGWSVLAERNNLPEDLDTGTDIYTHTLISLSLSASPLPCTLVYTIAYVCVAMALKTVSVSVLHHHCSHHIFLPPSSSLSPSSLSSSSPIHSSLLLLTPAASLRSSSLYLSLSVWMRQSSSLSCHVLCC